MNTRGISIALASLLVIAVASWGAALFLPFVVTSFEPAMPEWLPDILGMHERVKHWLVEASGIPVGPQTILDMVRHLWRGGDVVLAACVGGFAVVVPAFKIAGAGFVMANPRARFSARLARSVEWVGRWAMADVFVVAQMIVFFKADSLHFRFVPASGLYAYLLSWAALTAALILFERSRRAGR